MIEIICADALEVNPGDLPPFDVVITDPPYGDHVHANTTSIGSNGQGSQHRDLQFEAMTPELRAHVSRLSAAARRWTAAFSDVESTHLWRDALTGAGLQYIRTVPWIRWAQPQLSGDRPPTGCEMVTIVHPKGRKRWNGSGGLTHFSAGPVRTKGKHPTEKPLDLMLTLVSALSDPGETVLDPFAGFGTTLQAARLLGRCGVGIERNPEWARIAAQRIRSPLSGLDCDRARLWCVSTAAEAERVPVPRKPSELRTWERAQRRLADVATVLSNLDED